MSVLLDVSARPVIAHRGASADAPENTLASFMLAIEQGADALELDVHLSADGVPVVIHDPTLDRTTDRVGRVDSMTLRELRSADASAHFSGDRKWSGERIPTLAEVLEATGGIPLTLEIKAAQAQEAVQRELRRTNGTGRCVVASLVQGGVDRLRGVCAIGASRNDVLKLAARLAFTTNVAAPDYGVIFLPHRYHGIRIPPRRFVAASRPVGVPVHIWTVNDPETARELWAEGVNGIVTDRPAAMLTAREGLEPIGIDA